MAEVRGRVPERAAGLEGNGAWDGLGMENERASGASKENHDNYSEHVRLLAARSL